MSYRSIIVSISLRTTPTFATILAFCEPNDVRSLWTNHFDALSDDFVNLRCIDSLHAKQVVLRHINGFLESMGKRVGDYDLPELIETQVMPNSSHEMREVWMKYQWKLLKRKLT